MDFDSGTYVVHCDVVIIGAGISGLTTAREIRKKCPQLNVKIVEAKDRVGGRTLTTTMKAANGNDRWDLGGQWVGLSQTHIIELLNELGIETCQQYDEGTKLIQAGCPEIRPYSTLYPSVRDFKRYSIWEILDFLMSYTKIERLVKQTNVIDPFLHPAANSWDRTTLDEWVRQNCSTRATVDAYEICSRVTCGVESKRLSLLYFLYFAKAAGNLSDVLDTTGNGAQAFRITGGAQQVSEKLLANFRDDIYLETAVTSIEMIGTERAIVYAHSTANGKRNHITTFVSGRVVIAIPPNQCAHIRFSPPLPYAKRQLFDCAAQGNLLKCIVTYKEAFWRKKGMAGQVLSTGITDTAMEAHPVLCTFDASTTGGNPALVVFLHNGHWTDASQDERKDLVVKDLCRFFGNEAADYLDYADKNWCDEPYNGGCPTAVVPAGNMEAFTHIREPFKLVHFAGTEAATLWPGYMSGAVQSGLRAANEIVWHFQPEAVDEEALKDSVYDKDFDPPTVPQPEAYDDGRQNPWPRRIAFATVLVLGILAYMRFYGI
ncbi:Amine oxidase [flavin-containing] A [Toxocara canis]|uniref:Amine oxidase n=1 Tax=Toxocara canis TaxID=6265 RepID=A0A0B2VW87_TOXCA|nr:Amine oxidase [flavin-containing] A [Toxocara canis]